MDATLCSTVELLRQIGLIAADFTPQAQEALIAKMQQLVVALTELDSLKGSVSNVQVPIELLSYLEAGSNPDLYTKELLDKAMETQATEASQQSAYRELYKTLQARLGPEFK